MGGNTKHSMAHYCILQYFRSTNSKARYMNHKIRNQKHSGVTTSMCLDCLSNHNIHNLHSKHILHSLYNTYSNIYKLVPCWKVEEILKLCSASPRHYYIIALHRLRSMKQQLLSTSITIPTITYEQLLNI